MPLGFEWTPTPIRLGPPEAILGLALLLGCGSAGGTRQPPLAADWVRAADSTVIRESDALFLGEHVVGARTGAGVTYFSDTQYARVIRLTADGSLTLVFGRHGSGPGEFEAPSALGLVAGDSILIVLDLSLRRFTIYDLAHDSLLGVARAPASNIGLNWNVTGDSIISALTASDSTLLVWDWRRGEPHTRGGVPARLRQDIFTVLQHGRPEAVVRDQQILLLEPTEPGLHIADRDGRLTGFVTIPSVSRREIRSDLFDQARARRAGRSGKRIEPVGSMVFGMHELSSGHVALVYLDMDQVRAATPDRSSRFAFGNPRLYVTLLTPDLESACVDGLAPAGADGLPIPFFRGDTLFALARTVEPDDRVRSILRAYTFDLSRCTWQPTGGIGPARP